jgi:L-lactate dehydrogenase complex protein LldG
MVGVEMKSSTARSLILGRIHDVVVATAGHNANGERRESAAADHASIDREYKQGPSLPRDACLELFVDRLKHYQVAVHLCSHSEIAETIAGMVAARGKSRLIVPADIDRAWLSGGASFVPDEGLGYRDLDASEGVLTGCSLGIATTGTIVLRHGPAEGRRALTLIPDYHLCVVLADQVVETVPEALRSLAASRSGLVTTISGPSATADIEMTRIRGVHGPRTLDVIVVDAREEGRE